jgi:hypothetical protein
MEFIRSKWLILVGQIVTLSLNTEFLSTILELRLKSPARIKVLFTPPNAGTPGPAIQLLPSPYIASSYH